VSRGWGGWLGSLPPTTRSATGSSKLPSCRDISPSLISEWARRNLRHIQVSGWLPTFHLSRQSTFLPFGLSETLSLVRSVAGDWLRCAPGWRFLFFSATAANAPLSGRKWLQLPRVFHCTRRSATSPSTLRRPTIAVKMIEQISPLTNRVAAATIA